MGRGDVPQLEAADDDDWETDADFTAKPPEKEELAVKNMDELRKQVEEEDKAAKEKVTNSAARREEYQKPLGK